MKASTLPCTRARPGASRHGLALAKRAARFARSGTPWRFAPRPSLGKTRGAFCEIAAYGASSPGSPGAPLPQRNPAARRSQNQMVEQSDSHHFARLGHPSSERQVLGAGGGIARRMSVEEEQGGRTAQQPLLEHRARLDRRSRQRASEQLRLPDQTVPAVEKESAHDLLVAAPVAQAEIARDHGGLAQW